MSKKNSKKRWKNQHEEALRLERLDAEKKAARAAKRAEKLREASGEMMTDDGGSDARRRGRESATSARAKVCRERRRRRRGKETKLGRSRRETKTWREIDVASIRRPEMLLPKTLASRQILAPS